MTPLMLVWTEEYSVGVAELDEQHRHLFDIINELNVKVGEGCGTKESLLLLDALMDYNLYHLSTEEEHMATFGCISETHMEQHQAYREHTKEMERRARKQFAAESRAEACITLKELANFSGLWHINHIQFTDKAYTKCFNDHGLH